MEQRLLKETGIGKGEIDGLFAAQITAQEKEQFLAEAYRRRARQKAFRLQTEENES
jgi:hypothetical protein